MLQLRAMGAAAQCGLGLPCRCLLHAFLEVQGGAFRACCHSGPGEQPGRHMLRCVSCISDHEMALLRAMRCGLQLPCLRYVWAT